MVLLLICGDAWAVTNCISVIDPGGTGDYTSVKNWEDALGAVGSPGTAAAPGARGDLVTNNETATASCKTTNGNADTTVLTILGWTTGPNNYIQIAGAAGHRPGANQNYWDDAIYRHVITSAANYTTNFDVREEHVRFDGMQIKNLASSYTFQSVITSSGVAANSGVTVSNCIIAGDVTTGSFQYGGVYTGDADLSDLLIYNTVFHGFKGANSPAIYARYATAGTETRRIYNCTIFDCTWGILHQAGALTLKNTAIANTTNDVNATNNLSSVSSWNASDDTDTGSNRVALNGDAGGEWAASWTNSGVSDFSVKDASAPIYNTGGGDPSGGIITTDIKGAARTGNWDIGAFEYVVAASGQQKRKPTQLNINVSWLNRLKDWLTPSAWAWRTE
jgi:hypothetical protein